MRMSELHAVNQQLHAFNQMLAPYFQVPAPNTGSDEHEYLHDTDLGELKCWFEYEPAEPETDSPVVCNLTHAWLGDKDIAKVLHARVVAEIEKAALDWFEQGKDA